MKCPLCGTDIPVEATLIGPYEIYQPKIHGKEEGGSTKVCGRCFLLTSINDRLAKILEVLERGQHR